MSHIIRTEKPSALPLLGAGLVWPVLALVLPIYTLWGVAVTALASVGVYAVLKKQCPPQVEETTVPFATGVGDVDEMLEGMEKQLNRLRELNEALPEARLSAAMTRMENAGRAIVATVEQQPAKAKLVRRFANYYLPDAVAVLEKYAVMAQQQVQGENAAAVRREVEGNAAQIATAFENQLDALYEAESMDISADLTVLQSIMKGQGLSG